VLARKAKEEEGTPIATFLLVEGHLKFRWLPEGRTVLGQRLRNCRLTLQAGSEKKPVALREVVTRPPLEVRDRDRITLPIPGCPPAKTIALELLNFSGPLPASRFSAGKTLSNGRNTVIHLGGQQVPKPLALRVRFAVVGRGEVTAWCEYLHETPSGLTMYNAEDIKQEVKKVVAQIAYVDQDFARTGYRNEKELQAIQAEYLTLRGHLDAQRAGLELYLSTAKALAEQARLHFRIYAKLGEREVELVRSQAEAK
jgi:hypothetical protein